MIGRKITKEEALKDLKNVVAIPCDGKNYEVYTDLEDFEDLDELEGYEFYKSVYHTRISDDYEGILKAPITFDTIGVSDYELISMVDYN